MKHRSVRAWLFLWIAIGFFRPAMLQAQGGSGQVRLEVKDPSGANMMATGTIKGAGGFSSSAFQTDEQGQYAFENLPYGRYQIVISKEGFASQTLSLNVQSRAPLSETVVMVLSPQATSVNVVATTPLPGTDLPIDEVPGPVQTATAADLNRSDALDLSDLLNRRLNGVYINENQENPFQPDVNYRGYTASPLLGTPEGLSVYLDGVRQNEPFGDIVNWDLIPKVAISDLALIPGSDPLFGLNTLGGAVTIETKSGLSQRGGSVEASGGSFGRRYVQGDYGSALPKGFNWYVAGNEFHEDGWRVDSPSDVRQAFTKLGWQNSGTQIFVSGGYSDNELTGNGLQDFRFLQESYKSVYSIPDITWNREPYVTLNARQRINDKVSVSGVAYYRHVRTDTTNGDINDQSFDESLYNLSTADVQALTAAGYRGFPLTGNATTEPFPFWRCIAQGLELAEPIEKCTGIINNTSTRQSNFGLSGQASRISAGNHVTLGAAWDRTNMTYAQGSQFGYLNPDRITITPIDAFADGSTTQDGVPVDTRVNLDGIVNTGSVYATDTFAAGRSLVFTLSGRYNHTSVHNIDQLPLDPTGARGSLNGQYAFERFNPAAGVAYTPTHFATIYFNYSEANRAPTSIELGCADPTEPCNLPNALVSDPPLKQVVTRTFEAGVRGSREASLRWNFDWFLGENYNDLLFVASEQTGFGYFSNFGQTRRDGVEVSLNGKVWKFTLGGDYTFLNATYQSSQLIDGGSNSTNDGGLGLDGNIAVAPGDRIPQIPQHMFKAFADYQPIPKVTVDLDFRAVSSSFARGNENNLDQPDGIYYLGPGTSPGYGVVDLGAQYQIQKRVQLFVQIDNLLDHRYYTAAQLGSSPFDSNGNFVARPFSAVGGNFPIRTTTFFAPGAPIGGWGGLRFHF